jgi:hypothetical protein
MYSSLPSCLIKCGSQRTSGCPLLAQKFTLEQATKAQRGSKCIAPLFFQPRRKMGVGGQRHAPIALPPGNTRHPLYRRLGGPQGWSGRVRKISPPPGFDPRTVQPVASRYTNYAIPLAYSNINFSSALFSVVLPNLSVTWARVYL